VDDLVAALQAAGGSNAGREHTARLRDLLRAELRRGADELGLARSGQRAPVLLGVAAVDGAVRAAAPVPAQLRADPQATTERGWLLTAALLGAAWEVVEPPPDTVPAAGAFAGHLVVEVPGDPGAVDLMPDLFADQAASIDRLRARAVVLPPHVLEDVADLRAPIGAAHPLRFAARVAALGGRPADPASVAEHEEAALAALEAEPGAVRPHDDPDPARRVARRILQRLDGMGKWGGYHTEFAHLARGFAGHERALAEAVGERLLDAGLLAEKPSVGQRHVFLAPGRAGDIRRLIDAGELPAGLRLR
jgi:hypothetical protein